MVADFDERLRHSAAAPSGELDVADVRRRARRLRRSRWLWSTAGIVVVVAVISLGAITLLGDRDPQVVLDQNGGVEPHTVERPADGEVEPITAPDGEPALLIADGGEVRAVRAVDHMDTGMDELVMWCAPAEVFVTPSAFSLWNADGEYLGGPAPGDLVAYDTQVDGDTVTVGAAQPRPDRTADADRPDAADPAEACLVDNDAAEGVPPSTDPEAVVAHAHPREGDWRPVEQAVAAAEGRETVRVELAVTTAAGEPFRACTDPGGDPPRCSADAPRVHGLDPVDDDVRWFAWQGHAVVETDGTDITAFHHWVDYVAVDGETESQRARERNQHQLGPAGRITVDDERLTVPAVDLDYGNPPDQPIPAGTYELVLENHGELQHTLVSDDLNVGLQPDHDAGDVTASTTIHLPPGTHTFYCRLPGHRDAGMEFDLVVEQASP